MRGAKRAATSIAGRTVMQAAVLAAGTQLLMACGGAGKPATAASSVSEPVPTAAPALSTPAPAEVSAQVRSARAACSTEATKQQYEVIDFVTFNRLDENNWDSTIRARKKGKLVRIGCRHDLRAGWTYVYDPPASDGGNPWGPGGPPKGSTAAPGTAPASTVAKPAETRAEPKPAETRPEPKAPAKPAPKPAPGSNINLNAVSDTSARTGIARTRDACVAEAGRRKIAFDDFDAFRRVENGQWEAMLLVKANKNTKRACRFDPATGKATIK